VTLVSSRDIPDSQPDSNDSFADLVKYMTLVSLLRFLGMPIPYIPPSANAPELVKPKGTVIGSLAALVALYITVAPLVRSIYIKLWKRW